MTLQQLKSELDKIDPKYDSVPVKIATLDQMKITEVELTNGKTPKVTLWFDFEDK